jgi:signal transduction histidine kinase
VEARAVKAARTWYAAGLLAAAIAVLLVGWFVSGWADVRGRQRAEAEAPGREAQAKSVELAHELRTELSALLTREVDRPYFHYQNLMHDPRATGSVGVTPSPLASGPSESLVLGYFQIDAKGRATTPTINDDVPDLSEPKQLAGNQRFRSEVGKSLVALAPPKGEGTLVAEVTQVKRPPVKRTPPRQPVQPPTTDAIEQAQPQVQAQQQPQVIEIDENSYVQNWNSNSIYQQYRNAPGLRRDGGGNLSSTNATNATTGNEPIPATEAATDPAPPKPPEPKRVTPVPRFTPPPMEPAPVPKPVLITVAPLEWRTMTFNGAPALLAVRDVDTPDGALAQGFVVDRAALTSWLASHAGETVAELRLADDSSPEIAPGWHLSVTPNPRTISDAAANAAHLATAFLLRFIILGVIAAFAAALVVMLVARAERLALERSQFAAAAAHELRTPLAGLQLYGDMIADGLGDPQKTRDYAKRMSEEASRLGRVVSNVLGFSQLERGNLSVDPSVGSLDVELRSLAERAEPALDRAGAALALDVAPDLSAKFDRDALARIVGNLLDNAEKYGREAEDRTIELSARPAANGDTVEVVITDHGPGVTEKTRSKLFTPFTRGVPADGPAGLGLGLALSQSLARAMGGELDYRPGEGGGAAFVLRLPRA